MSIERDELARIIMSPESFDGGPASCGPNDVYAARIADTILAAGYSKHSDELVKYKRGAKTLGEIIEKQCRDVPDVTGLHHLINEDGDGHWDVVWMRLFEMRAELASLKESVSGCEVVDAELFKVASLHHIHGIQCLCGFKSLVSRDRTKHIMDAALEAATPYIKAAVLKGKEANK